MIRRLRSLFAFRADTRSVRGYQRQQTTFDRWL